MAKVFYTEPVRINGGNYAGCGCGLACGLSVLICLGLGALGTWLGFNMNADWAVVSAGIFVMLLTVGGFILGTVAYVSDRRNERDDSF